MFHFDTHELHDLAGDFLEEAVDAEPKAQAAIGRGGYRMEALSKLNAPVLTGALKSSISTTIGPLEAEVGPTVEYGIYVENGTSEMAPQPYLGPAFDLVLPEILDELADIVDL